MKQLYHLTLRHTVLFFKDKGRFLTSFDYTNSLNCLIYDISRDCLS